MENKMKKSQEPKAKCINLLKTKKKYIYQTYLLHDILFKVHLMDIKSSKK